MVNAASAVALIATAEAAGKAFGEPAWGMAGDMGEQVATDIAGDGDVGVGGDTSAQPP